MKNVLLAGGIAALLPLAALAETEAPSEPIFKPEAQELPKSFIKIEQVVPKVYSFIFTIERADGTMERIDTTGIEEMTNPFFSYLETTYPSEYVHGKSVDYSSVKTGLFFDFWFDVEANFLRYNLEDSELVKMEPYEVAKDIVIKMPQVERQTIRSAVKLDVEDGAKGVLFEGTGEGKKITKVSYTISVL